MNADLRIRTKEAMCEQNNVELLRDLLAEIERLRGIEKQAHDEGVIAGKRIAWLEYEVERLEEKLEEQKKRAVWNHEGVSRDYILAMKKLRERDRKIAELEKQLADSADLSTIAYMSAVAESREQIDALTAERDLFRKETVALAKDSQELTRQRDRLAAGLLRIKQMCQPNTLYHEVAIKTLADAGMEIK